MVLLVLPPTHPASLMQVSDDIYIKAWEALLVHRNEQCSDAWPGQ